MSSSGHAIRSLHRRPRIALALSDRPENWASPTGWPVFAATLAISLLASAVFGLPPAMRMTSAAPHRGRARAIFLAAQVAASCLLLMFSGLLARSLQRLVAMDPGFDYERAVVLDPGLGAHGYKGAAADAFMDQLRALAGSARRGTRLHREALALGQ